MNNPLIDLLVSLSKTKGCTFIRIADYTNAQGEIQDVTVNVGISTANAKAKDIEYLQNLNVQTAFPTFEDHSILETARQELLAALIAPDKARSEGQLDAYSPLCKGVKIHNETNLLYIFGYKVDGTKKVKVEGDYKPDTRKPLTKAKDLIRKTMKTPHYRQYALSKLGTIRVKGETLEITQSENVTA